MRLTQFRIKNYRSIIDSGLIEVGQHVALVGRNESGKTNLLRALESLNPAGGIRELSDITDFPRDYDPDEFSRDLRVVESHWELDEEEREELARLFPRARTVERITVGRAYKPTVYVGFPGLPPLVVDQERLEKALRRVERSLRAVARDREDEDAEDLENALDDFLAVLGEDHTQAASWAGAVREAVYALEEEVSGLGVRMPRSAANGLEAIRELLDELLGDGKAHIEAINWIIRRLPVFVYIRDVPALEGRQNIPDFIRRTQEGRQTTADRMFARLMKVAGLDPVELDRLANDDDYTRRQQRVSRASATITRKLHELWSDRPLKIRFSIDGDHFDTMVSDPGALYDLEVNLQERSRGFRWFFSLFVTFAADTDGGPAENAILLLDEPGLHLHALGQQDMLRYFKDHFENQILYATHSPFMIAASDLDSVRTVIASPEDGSVVHNTPTGDEQTLFPIQTALGYEIADGLFGDHKYVVVEEVAELWFLQAASDYLNANGDKGLPEGVKIFPAGGAHGLVYAGALLTARAGRLVVLLGNGHVSERAGLREALRGEDRLCSYGDISGAHPACVEDLLGVDAYHALVLAAYRSRLGRKRLGKPETAGNIVEHYRQALARHRIHFDRSEPARAFLQQMGERPAEIFDTTAQQHFTRLFDQLRRRLVSLRR